MRKCWSHATKCHRRPAAILTILLDSSERDLRNMFCFLLTHDDINYSDYSRLLQVTNLFSFQSPPTFYHCFRLHH
jgi:hypothetical protein